jgi:hypothetical protein
MTDEILAISLATEPVVGSNLRGSVSGAGWLYALPRLDVERIVCLGLPPVPTLAALARIGRVTLSVEDRDAQRAGALVAHHAWTGVVVTTMGDGIPEGPIDLIVVAAVPRDPSVVPAVLARLAPDGMAIALSGGLEGSPGSGDDGRSRLDLQRWPTRGEVRAMAPAGALADRDALRRLGMITVTETALTRGQLARVERWIRRRLPRSRRWGRAVVLGPDPAAPTSPPRYIRELAATAGRDLTGWGWAVANRGDYDSQKVLVLLREPGATEPSGVVKITRSSVHAARLRNEEAALSAVGALPIAAGRVPQTWFAGTHAGRAIVGESLLPGAPFMRRATYEADDPLLADSLGWLTDLAAATARPVPAADVAASLARLLERYERVYEPAADERATLRGQLERLAAVRDPIPLVRQHGDPGIWNLLAGPDGRTVFLDWEASEANGLPLWDSLYLFRSYAVAAGRRRGTRDWVDAARRHLLAASPLADRFVESVDAYCERIGVPRDAIEALTYGCWIHRSLKEANRLPQERLAKGQLVRLIRAMLAEPDAPTLARLFGRSTTRTVGS